MTEKRNNSNPKNTQSESLNGVFELKTKVPVNSNHSGFNNQLKKKSSAISVQSDKSISGSSSSSSPSSSSSSSSNSSLSDEQEDRCNVWDEDIYEVEEILDKRMKKDGPEYYIKWKDWNLPEHNTWQNMNNLRSVKHLVQEFEKKLKQQKKKSKLIEKTGKTIKTKGKRKQKQKTDKIMKKQQPQQIEISCSTEKQNQNLRNDIDEDINNQFQQPSTTAAYEKTSNQLTLQRKTSGMVPNSVQQKQSYERSREKKHIKGEETKNLSNKNERQHIQLHRIRHRQRSRSKDSKEKQKIRQKDKQKQHEREKQREKLRQKNRERQPQQRQADRQTEKQRQKQKQRQRQRQRERQKKIQIEKQEVRQKQREKLNTASLTLKKDNSKSNKSILKMGSIANHMIESEGGVSYEVNMENEEGKIVGVRKMRGEDLKKQAPEQLRIYLENEILQINRWTQFITKCYKESRNSNQK